jgi:UDP-glucose 4-epimerase
MLENDYDVYGLDINVPQVDTLVDYYNIDIRKLFDLPDEFDAVIHLAALVNVGESEVNPISYYITNLNGTMNVINKINTKNFIFASSAAVYGSVSGVVSEKSKTNPENPYGLSKYIDEQVGRLYSDLYKMNIIGLRFANV